MHAREKKMYATFVAYRTARESWTKFGVRATIRVETCTTRLCVINVARYTLGGTD